MWSRNAFVTICLPQSDNINLESSDSMPPQLNPSPFPLVPFPGTFCVLIMHLSRIPSKYKVPTSDAWVPPYHSQHHKTTWLKVCLQTMKLGQILWVCRGCVKIRRSDWSESQAHLQNLGQLGLPSYWRPPYLSLKNEIFFTCIEFLTLLMSNPPKYYLLRKI